MESLMLGDGWLFSHHGRQYELRLPGDPGWVERGGGGPASPAGSSFRRGPRSKPLAAYEADFALRGAVMFEGDAYRPMLESICRRLLLLTTSAGFRDYNTRELCEAVADAIERYALVAFDVTPPPLVFVAPDAKQSPEPPSPVAGPAGWFELRVVWDDTDKPVAGLTLVVQPEKSDRSVVTTDPDGRVRLDPVAAGSCQVRCSFDNLKHEECAVLVDTGEASRPAAGTGGGAAPARSAAPSGGAPPQVKSIVALERRKVRTGDTLDSLAGAAGMTAQDLAYFNCGSRSPKEINRFLGRRVGCTRKTRDKQGYVFHDSDDPGVLLVPKKWSLHNLPAGSKHTLRVAVIEPPRREFRLSW